MAETEAAAASNSSNKDWYRLFSCRASNPRHMKTSREVDGSASKRRQATAAVAVASASTASPLRAPLVGALCSGISVVLALQPSYYPQSLFRGLFQHTPAVSVALQ